MTPQRPQLQPFARGQGRPFTDFQPWLGGQIRIIKGAQVANPNFALAHSLRVVPRFCLVLDAGTASLPGPLPRGTTAWSNSNVYLNLPALAAGQNLTVLLA